MSKQSGLILALNMGSSSLKFGVFEQLATDERAVLTHQWKNNSITEKLKGGHANGPHVEEDDAERMSFSSQLRRELATRGISEPDAIVHRIVHGGPSLREHQRITTAVIVQLEQAVHFAPLHIPKSISLIQEMSATFPDTPQFACFDTAFHRTMPAAASTFAIPHTFTEAGVIRYGFHGLSCESIVYRMAKDLPERMVIAHLGSGASVTAVFRGKSIDTSMGLTPTGGLPMATRSGDLDPGVCLHMMKTMNWSVEECEITLNHESGLTALSRGEEDMQVLLAREASGDAAASLAVEVFALSVRKYIGAYAALMGGLDIVVFTGGIGEHAPEVRERICSGLQFLGISATGNASKVHVVEPQEEVQMARWCRTILKDSCS